MCTFNSFCMLLDLLILIITYVVLRKWNIVQCIRRYLFYLLYTNSTGLFGDLVQGADVQGTI